MDDLIRMLEEVKEGVWLSFTKKDGSERIIHATLHPDNMPGIKYNDPAELTKARNNMFNALDMEIGEWRTINLQNGYRLL